MAPPSVTTHRPLLSLILFPGRDKRRRGTPRDLSPVSPPTGHSRCGIPSPSLSSASSGTPPPWAGTGRSAPSGKSVSDPMFTGTPHVPRDMAHAPRHLCIFLGTPPYVSTNYCHIPWGSPHVTRDPSHILKVPFPMSTFPMSSETPVTSPEIPSGTPLMSPGTPAMPPGTPPMSLGTNIMSPGTPEESPGTHSSHKGLFPCT